MTVKATESGQSAAPAQRRSLGAQPGRFFGWLKRRWQGSLTIRIMVTTGFITAVVIITTYAYVSSLVGSDLFENRRDQVLADAARATQAAQRILDASDAGDRASLTGLMVSVRTTIRDTSSSSQLLVRRDTGQLVMEEAPLDFTTDASLASVISPELAAAVQPGSNAQYWQSVAFVDAAGATYPGIVVGSTIAFPAGAGSYELFLGYSLSEAETTLAFVQRTLILTSVLLMLLMGVLVWTVVRFVFRPIRVAAQTSRRLAEGNENERMPNLGDEQFNVLAASFNDMADTLQSRIGELNELSTMQQRFVSDVSHELRTPLTTIRLAGDVLYNERDDFSASAARSAELLHAQVLRFEGLLEDLLEISRYDAGSVELALEPTNIGELVGDVVESLRSISTSALEVFASDADVTVEVDPRRIRRIVTNLVGNAIEHGEQKPITVTVAANKSCVAVSVRDHGFGMTEEQAASVFHRFWRADPSRTRAIGGSGLGLAIALEDAQAHGGVLEVWTREGQGAHFLLVLPRERGKKTASPIPLVPTDDGGAS